MHQFNVYRIGPEIKIGEIDISFTNASLFMVVSVTLILLFLFLGTKEKKIISSRNVVLFKPSKEFKDHINPNENEKIR